ncbi:hypothetical protein ScPMuIL_002846, partial [Solemya velum]
ETKDKKKRIVLETANGALTKVKGVINLQFKLGSKLRTHEFAIVPNLNRKILLGKTFLDEKGVRLYFDLKCMKLDNEMIPIVSDVKRDFHILLPK